MKRNLFRNKLIFEPHEADRFFRAIRLYTTFLKVDPLAIQSFIEHERAHYDEILRLGLKESIHSYYIKVSRNRLRAGIITRNEEISKEME